MSAAVHAEDCPEFTEAQLDLFGALKIAVEQLHRFIRTGDLLMKVHTAVNADAEDDDLALRWERERERMLCYGRDAAFALMHHDRVAARDALTSLQNGMAKR